LVFPLNDFYSIGVDLTHVTNCGVFASKVVGESPSGGLGPVQLFAKMVLGDDILMILKPKTTHLLFTI
jgi:hypothetical protein